MGYGNGEEVKQAFNISRRDSAKTLSLPFSRVLRRNGRAHYVTIPSDYVKQLGLSEGRKYQFYVEVEQ